MLLRSTVHVIPSTREAANKQTPCFRLWHLRYFSTASSTPWQIACEEKWKLSFCPQPVGKDVRVRLAPENDSQEE